MKKIMFIFLMILFMGCEPVSIYLPEMPVTEPPPIEEVQPEIIYTNTFKISGYQRETTTQLNWQYPFLTYNGGNL